MLSQAFIRQSVSEDNRVAMPKINQNALSKIAVPVPPLREQGRLAPRVAELLELCDRLEGSLTELQTRTSSFLQSALYHALEVASPNSFETLEALAQ